MATMDRLAATLRRAGWPLGRLAVGVALLVSGALRLVVPDHAAGVPLPTVHAGLYALGAFEVLAAAVLLGAEARRAVRIVVVALLAGRLATFPIAPAGDP